MSTGSKRPASPASSEILARYLEEISKFPLLTAEEEKELGQRIQAGDEEALARLIESNLRFVVSYAKRYGGWGISLLDLIDEGNLGLIEAARRFDPSRNVRFLTYATWWIRRAILQALSREKRDRRTMIFEGEQTAGPSGTEEEETMFPRYLSRVSLSAPLDEEGSMELGDRLSDPAPSVEEQFIEKALRSHTEEALKQLTPKEARVLRLRFGLDDQGPRTLQAVGEELGLTRQRVQQIERGAIQKLRRSSKARSLQAFLN